MLKERGNLIEENIPITKELIEFAYANNYKISLKTGDYYQGEFVRGKNTLTNRDLLIQLNDVYMGGGFYARKYSLIFGFKPDRFRALLRDHKIPTLTGAESKELYKDIIDEQRAETNIELYGAAFPFQSPEIQAKCKQTNLLRYGFICPLNNPEIYAKAVETWIKNWGVDNPLKSEIIKLKIETTNLERYGYKSPLMSPEIQAKIAEIWIKNWGVDNPLKSAEIQAKVRKTISIRYGNCPFADPEIYAKAVTTWIENWGVDNPMKSAEVRETLRETMIARYDVPYGMQSEELKQRLFDNNMINFGVPYPCVLPSVRGNGDYSDEYAIQRFNKLQELKEGGDMGALHEFLLSDYNGGQYYKYTRDFKLRTVGKKSPSRIELLFKMVLDEMAVDYQVNVYKSFMRHPQTKRLRELDFFIPEFNIAFEINGEVTHSSEFGMDEDYHRFKYEKCVENGIKLVMLHERDFDNIEFVKGVLRYHLCGDELIVNGTDYMRLSMCKPENYIHLNNKMQLVPVGNHHWYPVGGENAVSG